MLKGKAAVRAGYHCAPLAHRAIGTSDRERSERRSEF